MTTTAVSSPPQPAPRRRRVWPWVLLVIVVVLVAAGFAVDALVRSLAERAIADRVAAALDVPAGTPVDVAIGGGPVLVQAATGSLDRVDIGVDDLALGPLTGDLAIVARGVALDTEAATRELTVDYSVPATALAAVAAEISGVTIDSVTLDGAEIVADGSIAIFGSSLGLGLGLTPSASEGDLVFTPTSIRVGGDTVSADEARGDPVLGGIADALLQPRAMCIADALPAALTLTRVAVEGDELVATLDGSGAALGGSAFQQKGTCAA